MLTAIIDYSSGNLHSARKAFEKISVVNKLGSVVVTSNPKVISSADRLVLPGDGAFPSCKSELMSSEAYEAMIYNVVERSKPFLGICVGMQLMAMKGYEYQQTEGLGWIDGEVHKINPEDKSLKIPHMGWNTLNIENDHPIFNGIQNGDHVYFVHSFQMMIKKKEQRLAYTDYGTDITAVVGRENILGLQFHPEKSGHIGLKMIENFLSWSP
jgi:glutamine amidotransferase